MVSLKRRLLRFVLLVVVPPLLGALAVWASEQMEARRGSSAVSSALRHGGHALQRTPPRSRAIGSYRVGT